MGNDFSLQLRQQSLMTKIMLKQEDDVIEFLQESKLDVTEPINQTGDTILHYAAYNSLQKLMVFLLSNSADPYSLNHRGLTPIDVAMPQIRQWLIHKQTAIEQDKNRNQSSKNQRQKFLESAIIPKHNDEQ